MDKRWEPAVTEALNPGIQMRGEIKEWKEKETTDIIVGASSQNNNLSQQQFSVYLARKGGESKISRMKLRSGMTSATMNTPENF